MIALLCATWIVEEMFDSKAQNHAVTTVVERNSNLTLALEQFTVRTVQTADALTRTLKAEAERNGPKQALATIVSSGLLDGSLFQTAGFIDEFGNATAMTKSGSGDTQNYADREHFTVHAPADTGRLYVGKPVISKILNAPSILFTRRINKPDGGFAGVTVVGMSPSRFSEFFGSAGLDADDFISVVGTDGTVRIMRSGGTESYGADDSDSQLLKSQALDATGDYAGPGHLDGAMRFVSYRTMREYNLIVAVGVSEGGALAGYRTQRIVDLVAAAAISLLIIVVGASVLIVERRREHTANELLRVARHDPLTGLPGRYVFQQRFKEALERASNDGTEVTLLFLDLDDFKSVNDTLGHDAGDLLLQQTAERLRLAIADRDTLARLGGDEFGIVLVSPLSLTDAVALGNQIVERLREPCLYEGNSMSAKASIGVAGYPRHSEEIRDLTKDADIALHHAKGEGGNKVVVFKPEMRAELEARQELLLDIRRGLSAGEFVPFYQPKVSFKTGRTIGFEALARWDHPSRGLLAPGTFSLAFDDAGLARLLGAVMIRTVAQDVARWTSTGVDCGRVAVNVSSAEFHDPQLAEIVMAAWSGAGAPLRCLEIEVTETVLLGTAMDMVSETLKRFRRSGITVALDDFGTGFASLAHLKCFEVDNIKIDQSFVRGLLESTQDQAIVSAVIGLGESFGMDVTAEGVETVEQAYRLSAQGCDFAQGYLYAKPMAASCVPSFLEAAGTTHDAAA